MAVELGVAHDQIMPLLAGSGLMSPTENPEEPIKATSDMSTSRRASTSRTSTTRAPAARRFPAPASSISQHQLGRLRLLGDGRGLKIAVRVGSGLGASSPSKPTISLEVSCAIATRPSRSFADEALERRVANVCCANRTPAGSGPVTDGQVYGDSVSR